MEELRPLLFTYAYNILGSSEDAKDVVQDAYLNYIKAENDRITDQKAYLVRTVINLSINRKKRQRQTISSYPGTWLPEPVETDNAETAINQKEVLSYSILVLLEKLNAPQRAVFILKEAFDYDHEEIADVLGITTSNSRKLLSRAKKRLREEELPLNVEPTPKAFILRYLDLIQKADMPALEELLVEDVFAISDGGGKAAAFVKPVMGRDRILRLITGLYKKYGSLVSYEPAIINHQPALLYLAGGSVVTCQIMTICNGKISRMDFIRNPDKLNIRRLSKTAMNTTAACIK